MQTNIVQATTNQHDPYALERERNTSLRSANVQDHSTVFGRRQTPRERLNFINTPQASQTKVVLRTHTRSHGRMVDAGMEIAVLAKIVAQRTRSIVHEAATRESRNLTVHPLDPVAAIAIATILTETLRVSSLVGTRARRKSHLRYSFHAVSELRAG